MWKEGPVFPQGRRRLARAEPVCLNVAVRQRLRQGADMQLTVSAPDMQLKAAYANWFRQMKAQVAFTGSALQCTRADNGTKDWITVARLELNVARFVERLSRDIYGRPAVRAGKSLSYIGVIEGQERPLFEGGQRLHVHLALGEIPESVDFDKVFERADYRWARSNWGYRETDSQRLNSEGDRDRWIQYLLKRFDHNRTERLITNIARHSTTH